MQATLLALGPHHFWSSPPLSHLQVLAKAPLVPYPQDCPESPCNVLGARQTHSWNTLLPTAGIVAQET